MLGVEKRAEVNGTNFRLFWDMSILYAESGATPLLLC